MRINGRVKTDRGRTRTEISVGRPPLLLPTLSPATSDNGIAQLRAPNVSLEGTESIRNLKVSGQETGGARKD